ncbi:MAG: hypothetical protein Q8O76_06005 [Chloroflexota bacterium]|nr:hypothetical protein [Chloroflexota bacterium]
MELSRRVDGKKFMWDGQAYPDDKQAQEAARKYRADGFLAEVAAENSQFYVLTRREIKEVVVVEGKPL